MALQNSQSECLNCWSFINNETENVKINQWHKLISFKNWQFYKVFLIKGGLNILTVVQRSITFISELALKLKLQSAMELLDVQEKLKLLMRNWNLYALVGIKLASVWSRACHYRIAMVWANISPSNTCSESFTCTSNCVSKEKETRKCDFISYKIFLKQYFV